MNIAITAGTVSLTVSLLMQVGLRLSIRLGVLEEAVGVLVNNSLLLIGLVLMGCVEAAELIRFQGPGLSLCRAVITPFYMMHLLAHVSANFKYYFRIRR